MRMLLFGLQYGPYLPIVALFISSTSLVFTVHVSRSEKLFPPEIRYPPLSLAGIYEKNIVHCYLIFAVVFVMISLQLLFIENLHWLLLSHTSALRPVGAREGRAILQTAHNYVRVGFLGLALTGLIPLQGWGGGATTVHSLSSLLFFFGSLAHGWMSLSAWAHPSTAAHPLSRKNSPFLWWCKGFLLFSGFLSFIPAQVLHPGGTPLHPHPLGPELADVERAGFGQWWFVGSLMLYYASMGFDFWVLRGAKEGEVLLKEYQDNIKRGGEVELDKEE